MGIYTPIIEVSFNVNFVYDVGKLNALPTPKYDDEGNFARLTKEEVQRWIDASKDSSDKYVYLIGSVFETYKYQCIILANLPGEPDREDADYSILFA